MNLPSYHYRYHVTGVLFALLIAFTRSGVTGSDLCDTAACKQLSTSIRANIDSTTDPCEDFYQYACGAWVKNNPVIKEDFSESKLTRRSDELQNTLRGLLEEEEASTDSVAVKAAKRHYAACIDEAGLDEIGITPLVHAVRQNGGVWPIAGSEGQRSTKTWQEVHDEYILRSGHGALYDVTIDAISMRATNYTIIVDHAQPTPFHELQLGDPAQVAKYVQLVKTIALKFARASGSTVSEEKVQKNAQTVADFAIALDKIRNPHQWSSTIEEMTLSNVQSVINNGSSTAIDLLPALNRIFSRVESPNITPEEPIELREAEYFQKLSHLVRTTPTDVILNYIHYQYLERHIKYTTEELRNLLAATYENEDQERYEMCVGSPVLETVLASMYVNRYSSAQQINAARDVLHDMKNNLMEQIRRSIYIDSESRAPMLLKIEKMIEIIGGPAFYGNSKAVEKHYEQYHLGKGYFENMRSYEEVEYHSKISRWRVTLDHNDVRTRNHVLPTKLGVFYRVTTNSVDIPTAILALPTFSVDFPPIINFAGLGTRITYMISQAYSSIGLIFDAYGVLAELTSNDVYNELEKRMQCFVEQYKDNTIKELDDAGLIFHTNATSRIAVLYPSTIALKTSFEAYQTKKAQVGADHRLLDLSGFDADKQFFLAYANTQCQSLDPHKLLEKLEDKMYTTNRMKVNAAISNLPQFSRAFNCPTTSRMNRRLKCSLFD